MNNLESVQAVFSNFISTISGKEPSTEIDSSFTIKDCMLAYLAFKESIQSSDRLVGFPDELVIKIFLYAGFHQSTTRVKTAEHHSSVEFQNEMYLEMKIPQPVSMKYAIPSSCTFVVDTYDRGFEMSAFSWGEAVISSSDPNHKKYLVYRNLQPSSTYEKKTAIYNKDSRFMKALIESIERKSKKPTESPLTIQLWLRSRFPKNSIRFAFIDLKWELTPIFFKENMMDMARICGYRFHSKTLLKTKMVSTVGYSMDDARSTVTFTRQSPTTTTTTTDQRLQKVLTSANEISRILNDLENSIASEESSNE